MNEYSVVMVFVSSILTLQQIKYKIMIRYNGKYYKLVMCGQLIMVSRNKSKCYEKLFSTMSYV